MTTASEHTGVVTVSPCIRKIPAYSHPSMVLTDRPTTWSSVSCTLPAENMLAVWATVSTKSCDASMAERGTASSPIPSPFVALASACHLGQ